MQHVLVPALTLAARRQSRTVRDLGLVCCTWLLLFGGGVALVLHHLGVQLDIWVLGTCALPPVVAVALACQRPSDARQYALHLVAATLMLPILLLFWASSVDGGEPSAPPAVPTLDAQAMFSGAEAVEDAQLRSGGVVLLRSGRFADGSELRLTRFSDERAAQGYVAMLSQALPAEPFTAGGRQGLRLSGAGVGAAWVVIERHGADLLELRARDREGVLARLAAQHMPVPQSGAERVPVEPAASWPCFVGLGVTHALVFVGLIAWAGSHLTRVPAPPGAEVATVDELRARLLSLAGPRGPFDVIPLDPQTLRFDASPSLRRTHRITLHIDAHRGCVHVREKLGVNGDAPKDTEEASMRSTGDEVVDPSQPDAQQVWSSVVQATMVVPDRLAAVPLLLHARQAELPPDYAATLDGEGVLTALCALVTRSGWHWQPRLFGRQG